LWLSERTEECPVSDAVAQAVRRLNQQLPLKERQDKLSAPLRALHREVLGSLVRRGRPLTRAEVAALVGEDQVDAAIARLGDDDLVVLSQDRREIVGAYPVTAEQTPHEVHVGGHEIHAMCALDAVSVGPMYDVPVEICSRCRVSGEAICIKQQGTRILEATPLTAREWTSRRWWLATASKRFGPPGRHPTSSTSPARRKSLAG